MLQEMPLIPQSSLTRAFRLSASPSDAAVLRRLRTRSAISDGLQHPLRDPHGRIRGSVHLYCALNRDAVYRARQGRWADAKRLAAEAARLEQRADTRKLATAIAAGAQDSSITELAAALQDCSVSLRPIVEKLAAAIEATRSRHDNGHPSNIGQVVRIRGDMAYIDIAGTITSIPLMLLARKSLDRVGAQISIDWQIIEDECLISVEPAIEIDGEEERYPFLPLRREGGHPRDLTGMDPVEVPDIPVVIHGR